MEYPATSKSFTIGNRNYIAQMPTLMLQTKIEDEQIEVTSLDLLLDCTSAPFEILEQLTEENFKIIYDLVLDMSYNRKQTKVKGDSKKAIELTAWLMNQGHMNAIHYRMDFVEIIINEMIKEREVKK